MHFLMLIMEKNDSKWLNKNSTGLSNKTLDTMIKTKYLKTIKKMILVDVF